MGTIKISDITWISNIVNNSVMMIWVGIMMKILMIVMWMMMAMMPFDGRGWKWIPADSQPLLGRSDPKLNRQFFILLKGFKSHILDSNGAWYS